MRKVFLLLLGLMVVGTAAFAANDFTQMTDAGGNAKETVQGTIAAWLWITALLPLGVSITLFFVVKDWQEQKEEQGQTQPKIAKYMSLLGAVIAGILIMYIVYGLIGVVFADKTFSEMWTTLVVDFYRDIF